MLEGRDLIKPPQNLGTHFYLCVCSYMDLDISGFLVLSTVRVSHAVGYGGQNSITIDFGHEKAEHKDHNSE